MNRARPPAERKPTPPRPSKRCPCGSNVIPGGSVCMTCLNINVALREKAEKARLAALETGVTHRLSAGVGECSVCRRRGCVECSGRAA